MAALGLPGIPMTPPTPARTGQLLLLLVALLVVALTWLKGSLGADDLLDQMARRSLPLGEALGNGRPTLVEFYADWCESCRAMAPAMGQLEKRHPELDVVLLNVDNPGWQAELDQWQVTGIPHLQLFDRQGQGLGHSIGLRQPQELGQLASALSNGAPLPLLAGVGASSSLAESESSRAEISSPSAGPRSHS
jgi:thiol-disulfide isomerase/thioredoxin